jgi:hypothetical protein
MIDFVKIIVKDFDSEHLLKCNEITFSSKVDENGVIQNHWMGTFHTCTFFVTNNFVVFSGSIHKMWNSINQVMAPNNDPKGFNGNQFNLANIIEVRSILSRLMNCHPSRMIFQNLEIGLNCPTTFNPREFTKGLLYHLNKEFEFRFNRNSAQTRHDRFYLKVYNKSFQYRMSQHTIRIEIKMIKAVEINSTGIKSFNDINVANLNKACNILFKRFEALTYFDHSIDTKALIKIELKNLTRYRNPLFWMETLKPNKRDPHKKRLAKLITSHSKNYKQQILKNANIQREEILKTRVTIHNGIELSDEVTIHTSSIRCNTNQKQYYNSTKIIQTHY